MGMVALLLPTLLLLLLLLTACAWGARVGRLRGILWQQLGDAGWE